MPPRSDRQLKISFLLPSLNLGGSEKHVIRLAAGLRERGHDAEIASLFREGYLLEEIQREGIPFTCLKTEGWRPATSLRIFRWLRRTQPGILHTYLFGFHFFAGLPARVAKVPLILSSRRDVEYGQRKRDQLIERAGNFFVDRVVCCAKAAERWALEKEKGISPEKLITLYNGIDHGRFQPQTVSSEVRRKLGIPGEAPVIGTVGNLSYKKGLPYLMLAVRRILEVLPSAWFLFVGAGPLEKNMKEKAKQIPLGRQIVFTGARSDVPDLMNAMDVFVLASLFEGLPNVLLEAMSLAKPVVATEVGGIPELIEPGIDGILIPPRDPQALAKAAVSLIENPSDAQTMGRRGQEKIRKDFTIGRMIDQYENLYLSLAESKGLAAAEGKTVCAGS